MANARHSDSDVTVLQCLLDAFPSVSLELIASAFTQASGDPDLAAEIISFSVNGIAIPQNAPDKFPQRSHGNVSSSSLIPGNRSSQGFDEHGSKGFFNEASHLHVFNGTLHGHGNDGAAGVHDNNDFHESFGPDGNRGLNGASRTHINSGLNGAFHVHGIDGALHVHAIDGASGAHGNKSFNKPSDLHGINGFNEASRRHGSNGACGLHEVRNFNGASSVHGSRLVDGVSHAHGSEAFHLHCGEASFLPGNRILNGTSHVHSNGQSYVYGHQASHVHGNEASSAHGHKGFTGASGAKQLRVFNAISSLPHPRRSCHLTLEDYFPSCPEKKAWLEPLAESFQKNVSIQNQKNTSCWRDLQQIDCSDEFPCLQKRESNYNSALRQPLRSSIRSTKRISVASGLVSNARIRKYDDPSFKDSPVDAEGPADHFKLQETTGEEKSMWPTETEAFLLSMLGEGFELGLEAVRDVLGHYEGDVEESMKVLLRMGSSSVSSDHALESAVESRIVDDKDSNLSQYKKNAVVVGANADMKKSGDVTKGENIRTKQIQALNTYHGFEKAILEQDDSSMKWVVERLCDDYPHTDMTTLLEILCATNFNYNDAEKMLREAGLQEGIPISSEKIDPRMILESLFIKPQEKVENKEQHKHVPLRKKHEKDLELLEKPTWKVAEVDIPRNDEASVEMKSYDMMPKWKVVTSSEVDIPRNEEASTKMRSYGAWDDYERHHSSVKQHWKTMETYFKAATAAYAERDLSKAEVLTEKGNMYKQLALEAKDRANNYLLEMKSQQSESDFTLDLQEQHVTEGLHLLRLHLKSLSSIPSCHTFTVITGCSKDANSGHIKLRHGVVRYLQKKGYEWVETSPFCLQIQLKKTQL